MPAASVGATNSWGIYLIASAVLVGIMTPQLMGVAGDSREGADWRCADGVRAALDALRPGVTIVMACESWPGGDPIKLGGTQVSAAYGSGTIVFPSRWRLPNVTLVPSATYRAWLDGAQVQVTPIG